ncbi:hypothetical protein [Sphingomonas radiodurans]|uniref:hypothetical protein n=1 Tax=Sphingomonas radiodurans TaxID=2890321 RepID=UPI001E2C0110|nr:hypothetical protein [Sphingomonas radiodurans]WBH16832.1 hypothetical protein LLW23_01535 [Sphingomonas radiodurans]
MMRGKLIAMMLPLGMLAACGGAGPQSVGSVAPPAPTGGTGSTGGTASGGTGAGVTGGSGNGGTTATAHFLAVSAATTFDAVGAMHSFKKDNVTGGELYQGNASTVRAPSGTIAYDPRDGIFTVSFTDDKAGITNTTRYQDPAHRTDFNPRSQPEYEVPNLEGFNYLAAADEEYGVNTFFYQRPGNATTYVTLAGFSRSKDDAIERKAEHGVFAFGTQTASTQIPIKGTGSYTGGFIATAVLNPTFDSARPSENYFQWLVGSSTVAVDFGKSTMSLGFEGTVNSTFFENDRISDVALSFPTGTIFKAGATAAIDFARSGGFTGEFQSASLGSQAIDFARVSPGSSTAGASSLDGAFYGPDAVNLGGNFRIVGGVPDQRIDIQGAFTGAKK